MPCARRSPPFGDRDRCGLHSAPGKCPSPISLCNRDCRRYPSSLDLAEIVSPYLKPDTRLRIAGNLPYNISTVIIEKLLRIDLPIQDMAFMVQLEVAQRITARPGTRDYGYFSLVCQHHSDVRLGFKVSPACFVPRPKVSSAMVSFRLKPKIMGFRSRIGFRGNRQGSLQLSTKNAGEFSFETPGSGKEILSASNAAGIDGSRRAEELSVLEYEHLAQTYHMLRMTGDE